MVTITLVANTLLSALTVDRDTIIDTATFKLTVDVSATVERILVQSGGTLELEGGITLTFADKASVVTGIRIFSGGSVGGSSTSPPSPLDVDLLVIGSGPVFFKSETGQKPADRWKLDINVGALFLDFTTPLITGTPVIGNGFDYVQCEGMAVSLCSPTFENIVLPFNPASLTRRQRPMIEEQPILGSVSTLKQRGNGAELITMGGDFVSDDTLLVFETTIEEILFRIQGAGELINIATPLYIRLDCFIMDMSFDHTTKNVLNYSMTFANSRLVS